MAPNSSLGLILLLGSLAACSNLLGGALALLRPRMSGRNLAGGLAFSGGFLLAVALLHILPECVSLEPRAPLLIVAGYFFVYLAEQLFAGHAHHSLYESHGAHPLIGAHQCREEQIPIRLVAALSAAAGLLLHSFFDGAAIAAALAARASTGWLTFLAVLLHKVPEGFSLAAIMLSSSGSSRTAAVLAAALGLASFAGTASTAFAAHAVAGLEGIVLSVAAGMFLHIAATDLLPASAQTRGIKTMVMTVAGAVSVIALSALLDRAIPH